MKKIVSLLLMLTMLMGIAAVNTSAAGILVQSNFSDMEAFTSNFVAGAFYTDNETLFGYSEARALQTLHGWYTYDVSCTAALADDEMNDSSRDLSLVLCNTNLMNYGRYDGTYYMNFSYIVEEKAFYLTGGAVGFNKDDILAGPIPYEGISDDGSEFNTFGMSVTRGRIRCFVDNKLIIDYVDTNDEYLIGLEDEYTNPEPIVFWNTGNFINFKDVKIATAEFLYPMASEPTPTESTTTTNGDDPAPVTTTKAPDATTSVSEVVLTDDKGNDVTDDSGNKVTETVIVTDAPVADTNTGAVQGGTSTSTGDKAIIVVAAMVVTLGCALIVKKANVR